MENDENTSVRTFAQRKWLERVLKSKRYEHIDRESKWGTLTQSEARAPEARMKNIRKGWMNLGVWQEPKDQATRDIAEVMIAREKRTTPVERRQRPLVQRTPQHLMLVLTSCPAFADAKEMVDVLLERTAEKSLRSASAADRTAEKNLRPESAVDKSNPPEEYDPTTFELEQGSVVHVAVGPCPLGSRAARSDYALLVDQGCLGPMGLTRSGLNLNTAWSMLLRLIPPPIRLTQLAVRREF